MDSNDFRLQNHRSLYDYLESEIQHIDFKSPLWGAIAYCLLVPITKEIIRSFNALVNKLGSLSYFWISGDSKIPFDMYVDQIRINDKKTKEIDDLLANTKQKDADRQKASVELTTLKSQYDTQGRQLVDQQTIVAKMRDIKVIDGVWNVVSVFDLQKYEYEMTIYDGEYLTDDDEIMIENFFYDYRDKTIIFNRQTIPNVNKPSYQFYRLKVQSENRIVGTQNESSITLTRNDQKSPFDTAKALKDMHREKEEIRTRLMNAAK